MVQSLNNITGRMKNLAAILIIVFLGHTQAGAQAVQFEASLDTNNILIGDQTGYRLQLLIPSGYRWEWPAITDTLTKNVEIVRKSKVDTVRLGDDMLRISQQFTITSFDTGYYVIPPFTIPFRKSTAPEGSEVAESEPFLLNVFSIPVDPEQPIKPIKGPIAVPLTFRELAPWILLSLVFVGLLVYFLTRKKKPETVVIKKPKPKIAPHLKALTALDNLKKEKLWQQDMIKDYYSKLTGIVREYVEERFDVPAIESTTHDTVLLLGRKSIQNDALSLARELLELADLVKFAKAKPLPSEHEQSMIMAEAFVKTTANSVAAEGSVDKKMINNNNQKQ
jgi:hypothetical protein